VAKQFHLRVGRLRKQRSDEAVEAPEIVADHRQRHEGAFALLANQEASGVVESDLPRRLNQARGRLKAGRHTKVADIALGAARRGPHNERFGNAARI